MAFEAGPRKATSRAPRSSGSFVSHCQITKNRPSQGLQSARLCQVAAPVVFQFRFPVFNARFRSPALAAAMPMPEAAMYKNGLHPPREDDIRPSRQFFCVKPVAVSETEEQTPHFELRTSIACPDGLHDSATLFGSPRVCHRYLPASSSRDLRFSAS